ncbi:MAG: 4Fe-4S binding protein [Desulfobacterales bacterium]|jgi:ferredoxin|nr:4Fe-4S binding protein [Desulfobacterales bacterium]
MADGIYFKLREQLGKYSLGFPATKSEVEIRILEKIFSEEEARMYLNLSMAPETPKALAERLKRDPETLSSFLEEMAVKGLLFRIRAKGEVMYTAAPFMIGIYENMIDRMDPELAKLFELYWQEAWLPHFSKLPVPLRFIPIKKSLEPDISVSPHDQIRDYIKSKDRIAIAECICRKQKILVGEGCGKPLETCMIFDWYADYFVENQQGRYISREEALEIQDRCDEAGLVTLSNNIKNSIVVCHCCECCCVSLRALNMRSLVLEGIAANYYAEVDPDLCSGCETCIERCQTGALSIGEDNCAVVDRNRCIGCGVCVTVCPVEALRLKQKPENEQKNELLDPVEASRLLAKFR